MILTHLVVYSFFDGASAGGGVPVVVEDVSRAGSGGRALRRQQLWSLTLDGKPYVFDSYEALMAFVDLQTENKVEKAEKKAERDANRIVLVGRQKVESQPPRIEIKAKSAEVMEYIDLKQAELDKKYYLALSAALARQAEEDEDIAFIATLQ